MANQSNSTSAEIITAFRGVYARVAAKLGVDASLVSKVANGKAFHLTVFFGWFKALWRKFTEGPAINWPGNEADACSPQSDSL